ncbi:MAG TPA: DUF4258 domain-containing protein, partial [Pyrinomonadaceae bacterium]|nr:DUF4258 domain-containing protein [Pyrinomonadaceae bacterium]
MNSPKLRITAHAFRRLAQRNITVSDLLKAVALGRKIHRSHALYYFVGGRDLPKAQTSELEHLIGLTVVTSGNYVLTAFRNKTAIAKIKRRGKR